MSELPDLVLLQVFRLFGITQRFRLRLVCKRWRFLVDQVKQSNLCLYEQDFPRKNELSPNRELEVQPDEMVWINTENKAILILETTFRKLERLFLFRIENLDNLIFQIDRLDRLKELCIDFPGSLLNLKLELKNLEVLSIRETDVYYLELNTPNLSTLVLWSGFGRRQVNVLFPEKVTFLECDDFPIDLKQFVNLETLFARKLAVNLVDHPKLKVLDLRDEEEELWKNLRQQASARKDLTIYSFGFKNIFCPNLTSEPVQMFGNFENFVFEHHELLELPIPFKIDLNYHKFLSAFGSKIPKSLFQKLINIRAIQVESYQSVNHLDLISLLKESKCFFLSVPSDLNVLPQTFYDSLPGCFLEHLAISDRMILPWDEPNDLKFDFLPKLTRLQVLSLDLRREELPLDSIGETIQSCRYLNRFNLTNDLFDKQKLKVEIGFTPKRTKTFKVNDETLQNTTKEEAIRYLRENVGMLQPPVKNQFGYYNLVHF